MTDKTGTEHKQILYCNFCGKSQNEVKLIAGPTVFICYECVDMCWDIKWEHQNPTTKEPEKYRVTYSVLHVCDNHRDFDTIDQAFAFQDEWRRKEDDFIRRHQNSRGKITKIRERDL